MEFNHLAGVVTKIEGDFSHKQNPLYSKIEKIEGYSRYGTLVKITNQENGFLRGIGNKDQSIKPFRIMSGLTFARFRIINFVKKSPFIVANVEVFPDEISKEIENDLLQKGLIEKIKKEGNIYLQCVLRGDQVEIKKSRLQHQKSVNKIIYTFAQQIESPLPEKLLFLQINDPVLKLNELIKAINLKTQQVKVTREIEEKVRQDLLKENRNNMLRRQLDHINKQLYGDSPQSSMQKSLKMKRFPPQVQEVVQQELKKLNSDRDNMDKNVTRKYLETLFKIPWQQGSLDSQNILQAKATLDRDHAGLSKVKERILQYLAVKFLKGNAKGTIICLHGPPGVGKTSIAKSIAEALGRSFDRISLGGVHDQSQIRGHRRTYVSALPGLIIQSLIRCKTNNPVILLDEIDKITRSARGDPSSAMLQVLDPNQNSTFTDHYVSLPFDLSRVFFIATANSIEQIQAPLLDRMELIEIGGYTVQQKQEIGIKYLIPKQIKQNGLSEESIQIKGQVLPKIVRKYTFQAGVRQLEQKIAAVCRNVAKKLLQSKQNNSAFQRVSVDNHNLHSFLGAQLVPESDIRDRIKASGVAIGMAYTTSGGRLLLVETAKCPGKGRIEFTGSLGNVMKESVKTVLALLKSQFGRIVLRPKDEIDVRKQDYFQLIDLHVHFPSAATPKDGPSAGITILCALVSLLTGIRCKSNLAMTGQVSLSGFVLPVGGIKQKCIAAYQQGVQEVMIPAKNQRDFKEIPENIRSKLKVHLVNKVEDALAVALVAIENPADQLKPDLKAKL